MEGEEVECPGCGKSTRVPKPGVGEEGEWVAVRPNEFGVLEEGPKDSIVERLVWACPWCDEEVISLPKFAGGRFRCPHCLDRVLLPPLVEFGD